MPISLITERVPRVPGVGELVWDTHDKSPNVYKFAVHSSCVELLGEAFALELVNRYHLPSVRRRVLAQSLFAYAFCIKENKGSPASSKTYNTFLTCYGYGYSLVQPVISVWYYTHSERNPSYPSNLCIDQIITISLSQNYWSIHISYLIHIFINNELFV